MNIIVLIALVIVLILVWKKKSGAPKGVVFYVIMGGLIVGLTALFLGVIGAIIIYPESNIAPIIGFIYTGPIGFVLGLIGGGLYWGMKVRGKHLNTINEINAAKPE